MEYDYVVVGAYFKRSEDNERGADAYHGVGGPLHVSDSRVMSHVVDVVVEAAVEAGHEFNPDFNGAAQLVTLPGPGPLRDWRLRRL